MELWDCELKASNNEYDEKGSIATQNIIHEYRLHTYDCDKEIFIELKDSYAPSFPVIIKSDGTIWDKAVLYLNHLLSMDKSTKLIKTAAGDLLDFLRFIEAHEIDMLHVPSEKELRVTYRYRQYLINKDDLTSTTKSQRINRIIAFYKFCFANKLFTKEEINNRLYKVLKERLFKTFNLRIWYTSNEGFIRETEKESTDLRIKRNPSSEQSSDGIKDGRQLHPLSPEEQEIFGRYLKKYGSRVFQLICIIAINTGARLQTICTLRTNDIQELKKGKVVKNKYKEIIVGKGTTIDNKQDKQYKILFPIWIIEQLENYINSVEWEERASKSYYKKDNNYIFLSKFGNSFYTSKKEIQDRKLRKYPTNGMFVERKGESIRKNLDDIWQLMEKNREEIGKFSIHDLRATFGLNLLHQLERFNKLDQSSILNEIRERMGHSSRLITENYLNYYALNQAYANVSEKYTEDTYRFDY